MTGSTPIIRSKSKVSGLIEVLRLSFILLMLWAFLGEIFVSSRKAFLHFRVKFLHTKMHTKDPVCIYSSDLKRESERRTNSERYGNQNERN